MKYLIVVVLLMSSLAYANPDLNNVRESYSLFKHTEVLLSRLETRIEFNNADMNPLIIEAISTTEKISEICNRIESPDNSVGCFSNLVDSRAIVAQMKINIAKYTAQKGDLAAAKQMYRDVVISFTGDSYKAYVKQAEFGLEDLKDIEKKKPSK